MRKLITFLLMISLVSFIAVRVSASEVTTEPLTTEGITTVAEEPAEERSLSDILDAGLVTDIITVLMFLTATYISVKQRAKIIVDSIKSAKKDEELAEKDAVIAEQTNELEIIGQALGNVSNTLNLIVQASKMSPQDKAMISQQTIITQAKIEEFINTKKERLAALIKNVKEVKQNPSEALNVLIETGGSVLEKYINKSSEQ